MNLFDRTWIIFSNNANINVINKKILQLKKISYGQQTFVHGVHAHGMNQLDKPIKTNQFMY